MIVYGFPALFALFVWWFSTGAIMYLDGLPRRTFKWSMIGASLILAISLWGVSRLHLRAAGLGLAGDQLLHGLRDGAAPNALPRRLQRLAAFRACDPNQPVA